MVQKETRLLDCNPQKMTKLQITAMLARIDAATQAMKDRMKDKGTQYKLRVGIPTLRDFNAAKKRLNFELETRK